MAERFGCSGSTRQPRLRSCGSASAPSFRTPRCQAGYGSPSPSSCSRPSPTIPSTATSFSLAGDWTTERAQAFDSLSGGQRQRLFIALAFVNSPELVFLDELTQGLDPQARRATWELIREIREGGTTVVLVTHFMDEAEHLCDRVAVVDSGKVVALDTPQGLIDGLGLSSVVRFTTSEPDLGWLEKLDVVESIAQHGEAVEIRGTGPVLALVASELVAHGIVPLDLRVDRPTLEDAFLALTGRDIRG